MEIRRIFDAVLGIARSRVSGTAKVTMRDLVIY